MTSVMSRKMMPDVFLSSSTVKPFIVGEGLQSMIIKKGQVITFDIKYGGEPEPEVKWMKGEEVRIMTFLIFINIKIKFKNITGDKKQDLINFKITTKQIL